MITINVLIRSIKKALFAFTYVIIKTTRGFQAT